MYQVGNPRLLQNLCVECATILRKEYSGVGWSVFPSPDGSMLIIKPLLNIGTYGFYEYTSKLQEVTGRRKLLKDIGGKILEHFRIERAASRIMNSDVRFDKRGALIPDLE